MFAGTIMAIHEVISYPGSTSAMAGKSAIRRSPTEANYARKAMRTGRLICPTGCLVIWLSSPDSKNISLPSLVETSLGVLASRPTEGRIAIVTDAGRDAVDAAAFCAQRGCRAGFGL
jgi:hypothetical protein